VGENQVKWSNQAALFIALLSSISFSAYAQDICSGEGRSKMRSANITDTQISKICPPVASNPTSPSVDYREVKAAVFDAANAVGKTIYFDASYRELGTSGGRPTMLIKVDTNTDLTLWRVFFDSRYNNTIGDLRAGQKISMVCRITELSGLVSKCELIKLSVN
jgi:hypothetical protein